MIDDEFIWFEYPVYLQILSSSNDKMRSISITEQYLPHNLNREFIRIYNFSESCGG